jgi:bacteriorhodopsin
MSSTVMMVADPALKGFLDPNDPVAISFWVVSMAMVASTVFFLMESTAVKANWKTSLNVGALVTLVAAVHYFYMREFWVQIGSSPTVYRYIDWSITVPLQMIEFYFILSAVQPNLGAGMFWRLLIGTVIMLAFGYAGEASIINAWAGFAVGMAGWAFILFEIFMDEAGNVAADVGKVGDNVKTAFAAMRFIVTVGWAIYPLATSSDSCVAACPTPSSTWCTTLPILSTRLPSALPSGLLPRRTHWGQLLGPQSR